MKEALAGFENGKAPGKVNEQALRSWHLPNAMRGDMGFHKAWPAEFSMFLSQPPLLLNAIFVSNAIRGRVISVMLPC